MNLSANLAPVGRLGSSWPSGWGAIPVRESECGAGERCYVRRSASGYHPPASTLAAVVAFGVPRSGQDDPAADDLHPGLPSARRRP
jgi:hypothetical protein